VNFATAKQFINQQYTRYLLLKYVISTLA